MSKFIKSFLLTFILLGVGSQLLFGETVYKFNLKTEINSNAWRLVKNGLQQAQLNKADYVLIELNTFGGEINFADSIRTRLLASKIKTIVYINNNAASAGALISLAADYIFMQQGGSIGAASVVNAQGEVLPEKYQSYMRSLMRATAEVKGRNPQIAEAFVDPSISIPSLKMDGKLLTLTSEEAAKVGLITGEAKNINDIYTVLKIDSPNVIVYVESVLDKLISFIIHPMVSALLVLLIIGGIYLELQSPGIGFPLVIALLAAIFYFVPLYGQGLADSWEIALFVVGIILLALEIFVIPGFGVAGILGLICTISGLSFSLVANDFLDFKLSYPGMLFNSFIIVLGAILLAIVLFVIFGKNLIQSTAFKRLVLADEQQADQGYTSSVLKADMLGRRGVAKTVLRPSGKIEIDSVWYDAVALDGFIDAGDLVQVEKHENYNLFVRKCV